MKNIPILNINHFRKNDVVNFYANTLENHLVTAHKDIAHPHSHNFYLSVLFTQGSGVHEVDFSSYDVKPGALFFLNPGQTHHWELSADTKGYIFFHTQDFYDVNFTQKNIHDYPFFYSLYNPPCLYLNKEASAIITNLFRQLLEESTVHKPLQQHKILALAELIYIESTRIYIEEVPTEGNNKNNYYIKFRQLEDLVEKHFRSIKAPSAYAEMMNMSPKHLNRITQAVAGKSAGDVITERVLLEAKKQLVLQRGSLNEIAYDLGYEDYAYFSRIFKKGTGATPSEFTRKYRIIN
jgi:AraC family transcriptional activator of pobA